MPIYEYQCRSCGHRTEALQRMSDPPLSTCGECGGELKRLISSPSFQFKGSGWYVTDYARAGGDKAEKAEGSQKNGSEAAKDSSDAGKAEAGKSTAGGSAEAKPAAKPTSGGGTGSPSD
jgi:putative FmdB family regulatory protein